MSALASLLGAWLLAASLSLPGAAGQDVVVDLSCAPAEAELGEPVTWTLVVEHPGAGRVTVANEAGGDIGGEASPFAPRVPADAAEDAEPRRLWVELEPRRRTVERVSEGGAGAGRTRTTFTWVAAALDAGERTLEDLRVVVDLPDRVVSQSVDAGAHGTLLVRGSLGDGEDAPRPLAGFRPAPPGAAERTSRWLVPALVLAGVAALAVALKRRRRSPILLPDREHPLEELDAIAESVTDEPGAAAELGYDLSHLLRRAADRTLGESRAELTDAEWARRLELDERLPARLRGPLGRLVRDLEPLKYAAHRPTRFALRELLDRAREPLEELVQAHAAQRDEDRRAAERRGRRGAA